MPPRRPAFLPCPSFHNPLICGAPSSSHSTNTCVKFRKIMSLLPYTPCKGRVRLVPSLSLSPPAFLLQSTVISAGATSGWLGLVCVGESVGRSVTVHLPSCTLYHLLPMPAISVLSTFVSTRVTLTTTNVSDSVVITSVGEAKRYVSD